MAKDKIGTPATETRKAIALMIGAGIFFSLSFAVIKFFGQGMPALQIGSVRSGVGTLILLAVASLGKEKIAAGNAKALLFLRAVTGAFAMYIFIWAVDKMDLGLANALNQTAPVFVCVLAAVFLKERFPAKIYLLVLTAFAGITLMISPDLRGFDANALFALSSGFLAAVAYTTVRFLRKTESTRTIVLWFMTMSTVIPLLFIPWQPWVYTGAVPLVALLLSGFLAYGGQMLMTSAYRYGEATVVAPFMYTATLTSYFFGFLFWDEMPAFFSVVGAFLLIGASVLIGSFSSVPEKTSMPTSKNTRKTP